jgi:hypothetical protein
MHYLVRIGVARQVEGLSRQPQSLVVIARDGHDRHGRTPYRIPLMYARSQLIYDREVLQCELELGVVSAGHAVQESQRKVGYPKDLEIVEALAHLVRFLNRFDPLIDWHRIRLVALTERLAAPI